MRVNIQKKLLFSFGVIVLLTLASGSMGIYATLNIESRLNRLFAQETKAALAAAQANVDFKSARVSIREATLQSDPAKVQAAIDATEAAEKRVREQLAIMKSLVSSKEEQTSYDEISKNFDIYMSYAQKIYEPALKDDDDTALKIFAEAAPAATQADKYFDEFENSHLEQAQQSFQQSQDFSAQNRTITIVLTSLAVLVGIVITILVARSLSEPAKKLSAAAEAISRGELDITLDIKNRDEMGDIALAFQKMIAYLQEIASVAGKVSSGDLTANAKPISNKDVLGNAFERMILGLRNLIGGVSESVSNLNNASSELASSADQAGDAANQISTTIQQITQGINQQSESISHTAASVEQTNRAISGVAKGAQEQSLAVNNASSLTAQLSDAIHQVSDSAGVQSQNASKTVHLTDASATAVSDTAKGMERIRNKVNLSTEKVRTMGEHSNQIGAIVELIDDISSQTNLLALNAAIEAARAGEAGKGFSVVADEVRKLAERSTSATKDISGLVKSIQASVLEAINAMNESSKEVDQGVNLAEQSKISLDTIMQATLESQASGEQIVDAAARMNELAGELVAMMDNISAVVEENTASSEEMSASSNEVLHAIENIASVSEENSAAVEEVSASTEEMSAQIEEVSASAQSLSEMADTLQNLVSRFQI
ncbi:MAG: methyl-accepting chemotaxis protein [Anaerolineae bacterium]|nr:methyl-accepting chemotaxis protein [Anaerolineae bacterium]